VTRMQVRQGFTLVETVVALVLLGVILVSLLPAIAHGMRVNSHSEIRTGAVAVAQQEIDNLRAIGDTWPASGTVSSISTGSTTFQSRLSYQQYCDANGCYDGARLVTVEVSHNGRMYYRVRTVFTSLDATGT